MRFIAVAYITTAIIYFDFSALAKCISPDKIGSVFPPYEVFSCLWHTLAAGCVHDGKSELSVPNRQIEQDSHLPVYKHDAR